MKNGDFIARPEGRAVKARATAAFVCLGLFLLAASQDARAEVIRPTPRDVSLGIMVALTMGAREIEGRETEAIVPEAPTPAAAPADKKKACAPGYSYAQKMDACRKRAAPRKNRAPER